MKKLSLQSGKKTSQKKHSLALMSMSGFGAGSARNKTHSLSVEIRALNSRYFDCSVRLPNQIGSEIESKVREVLEHSLQRGRVEANFVIGLLQSEHAQVTVDKKLLANGVVALRAAASGILKISDDKILDALLARREIFDIVRNSEQGTFDEQLVWKALKQAVEQLVNMRRNEGHNLGADLLLRLAELEKTKTRISEIVKEQSQRMRADLTSKINSLVGPGALDPRRIEQEVALLASKADVHEELVRLGSHIEEFKRLMGENSPGKRLDFLTQEFLREFNTIGSKVSVAQAQHEVIHGKGIVEKIKEQVQNIA